MNIVKRNNYLPTSFFDDFLTKDLFDWTNWNTETSSVPKTNILETDVDFEVQLAAPGMSKEDFNIELEQNILVINCDKQIQEVDVGKEYKLHEFSFNSFKRTFHLPNTVEMDSIKATYKDGILYLTIPKKEEAKKKPSKKIEIS